MNVQNINLDLSKAIMAGQIIRMGQGDSDGTTIRATILDNSAVISLSGMSATFCMRLPDGVHYVRDTNCTISGNVITYVVDEEHCCAVAGYTDEAYFEVVSGSTEYSTSRFRVKVERAAHDGAVPAESWETEIDELIERGEQAVSDANQALADANASIQIAHEAGVAAAEEAASEVEGRVQAAIDAMGDISEQAVPLMSSDTRGGAKLEEHGGLALRDGALGIGSLVQESDGYARGGLAEVTAKGHAEQFTTTGKNLLPNNATSQTINGVTFTVNADGSVTANGTATADAALTIVENLSLDAGSYCLSGCPSGGNQVNKYSINLHRASPSVSNDYDEGSGKLLNFSNEGIFNVGIIVRSDVTVSNLTFYPQLELGSTATEYEPYTGGAPSPSPDYPQEIQVVRGRNLLDESKSKYQKLSANGDVSAEGSTTTYLTSDFIEVAPSTTYHIQNIAGNSVAIAMCFYGDDKTFVREYAISGRNVSTAFTTDVDTRYIRVTYFSKTNANYVGPPQLTLGSTPQPYVPYGHVGMEAQGKNLIDPSRYTESKMYLKEDNTTGTDNGYRISQYFTVQPSSTLSIQINYDSNAPSICFYDEHLSFISGQKYYRRRAFQVSVPPNAAYARASYKSADAELTQIEVGSTPTEYEPYWHTTTPIPLPQRGWVAGLRDGTADSLRLDGAGKCEWELADEEVVLDGSSVRCDGFYNNCRAVFNAYAGVAPTNNAKIAPVLSDMFAAASANSVNTGVDGIAVNAAGTICLCYMDGGFTTYADVNAWLSTHNVTVLYPLATPIIEDCGYCEDWPTDIPEGCVIDIPELSEVGIKYFIDSSVTELAKQWYERANSEYEDRLQALEEAMATIITGS